jgi:hypothetical protein
MTSHADPETWDQICARARATWAHHRDLYDQREDTWRQSPNQRLADWTNGCGWCGKSVDEHPADPTPEDWAAAAAARVEAMLR